MTRFALALLCGLMVAATAEAGSLVAVRTLRAQSIITDADVVVSDEQVPGALTDPSEAVGLETRSIIYPGRPIHAGDLTAPAIIERNQLVPLAYQNGGLSILTEGRALDRGAVGSAIRIMNVTSKATLFATIGADGVAYVQPQ